MNDERKLTTLFLDKVSLEYPIVQAAMGGGIATPELVCAVSKAGGLGSLGISPNSSFKKEIREIKQELAGRPFSVNLLLPLTTKAHVKTILNERVPIVSIFCGYKKGLIKALKDSGCIVMYQIGSIAESAKVIAEGADILIAQGQEAGGHLRGAIPLVELLSSLKTQFPQVPIVAAGGIHNAESTRQVMSLGADAIAAGTRFLMSVESGAHKDYKKKLVAAEQTIITELFGMGWHEKHRVLKNSATEKWINQSGKLPLYVPWVNKSVEPFSKFLPTKIQEKIHQLQSARLPFYSPIVPNSRMHNPQIEYSALYAGQCVNQLKDILPAAMIVKQLADGL